MSAPGVTAPSRLVMRTRGSVRWRLAAAALLLGSAALQIQASLQRWVGARDAYRPGDVPIEDHVYDYDLRSDSWEPIGTAAQVHGLGMILLTLGILALGRAVRQLEGPGLLLVSTVAAPFALLGISGIVAGITGAPNIIDALVALLYVLNLAGVIGVALFCRIGPDASITDVLTGVFLLGSSLPGYLFASVVVAPLIHGSTSHDTTPWTETAVGATTGAAGIMALVAAGVAAWSARDTPRPTATAG